MIELCTIIITNDEMEAMSQFQSLKRQKWIRKVYSWQWIFKKSEIFSPKKEYKANQIPKFVIGCLEFRHINSSLTQGNFNGETSTQSILGTKYL